MLWAVGALAVCCTVHLLLLAGVGTGIAAALAGVAASNKTVVVAAAGAVLATLTGVVIAWHRRRRDHCESLPTGCPPVRTEEK